MDEIVEMSNESDECLSEYICEIGGQHIIDTVKAQTLSSTPRTKLVDCADVELIRSLVSQAVSARLFILSLSLVSGQGSFSFGTDFLRGIYTE